MESKLEDVRRVPLRDLRTSAEKQQPRVAESGTVPVAAFNASL